MMGGKSAKKTCENINAKQANPRLGEEEKCGAITYEVLNANETPQTLVKLERDEFGDVSQDKLVFQPGLDEPEGVYFLLLRGKLIWGPDSVLVDQVDEPFQVVVDSCFANLDLSLVTIPNLVNLWYADTVEIDVSHILR